MQEKKMIIDDEFDWHEAKINKIAEKHKKEEQEKQRKLLKERKGSSKDRAFKKE